MKHRILLVVIIAACFVTGCYHAPSYYVNPMVGTDGHGHTTPSAIVPFGMIQPGPDTRLEGWDGCSGYHYSDDTLYGFSHTHLSGTGCEDYCDVLVMPFDKFTVKGKQLKPTDYQSHFSHRHEHAEAGYYRVMLDRYHVMAELTATQRVAYHRYTFSNSDPKGFIIDLQHRDKVISAGLHARGNNYLMGWRESNCWNPDQKLFFTLHSNTPWDSVVYLADSSQAVVYFPPKTKKIELQVAISGVDIAGSLYNLNSDEQTGRDFDTARKLTRRAWDEALGKIEIKSIYPEQTRNFYTALYHCMTSPYLWSDVDGRYRGTDGHVHLADLRPDDTTGAQRYNVYTVFSLWDTYRALHPLLTLLEPERTQDFIYTFLKQYQQGGELTMWELAAHETHCMIGYHSCPVILDALKAQLVQPEWQMDLLTAMVVTSNRTDAHQVYAATGYLSSEVDNESVSKTLEYAYDDWCIAQYAHTLSGQRAAAGETTNYCDSIYSIYMRRSQSWRNLMDVNGFMHARRNGAFITPFDPTEVNNNYTEANCWQYSTYVPHDVMGWVAALGGKAKANTFLDSLFYGSSQMTGRDQADITGTIGQYAHGNEPSHHAAYLYTYLGYPDKTNDLVKQILRTLYHNSPDGLCGNEDCGQMSAWYVCSAMGLYPVCPGSGEWVTTEPLFESATLHLKRGDLTINHKDWPAGKFWRNGEFHDEPLAFGCESEKTQRITPSPFFGNWQQRFKESAAIDIHCADAKATIYYTLDGNRPDTTSARYTAPILITYDATIKAIAYNPTTGYSRVVSHQLTQFYSDRTLTYITQPAPQYYENGEEGLIDRLHGTENYRIGGWQGWTGDMEVIVDLQEPRQISNVGVECLENMRSWIFFPSKVEVFTSEDGNTYTSFGEVTNDQYPPIRERQEESVMHTFTVQHSAVARYVKIKTTTYGKMPQWHVSAGEQAWLFIDEVTVE